MVFGYMNAVRKASITLQLRLIFVMFSVIGGMSVFLFWSENSQVVSLDWVYRIAMPVALISLILGAVRPRVGGLYRNLAALQILSVVRIFDFWQHYFLQGGNELGANLFIRGTVGWAFIAIFIWLVDLLDDGLIQRLEAAQKAWNNDERVD